MRNLTKLEHLKPLSLGKIKINKNNYKQKYQIKKMADPKLNDFDQPIKLTDRELKQLIPGYLTVFREMGMRTLRSGNVEEALRKFHAAAAAFPDDARNLLGRGQSRYRMKLLQQAQSDAEKVLQ